MFPSGRLTLANPGAIFNLLDGPVGSDPAFYVVWCSFLVMRAEIWESNLGASSGCSITSGSGQPQCSSALSRMLSSV